MKILSNKAYRELLIAPQGIEIKQKMILKNFLKLLIAPQGIEIRKKQSG